MAKITKEQLESLDAETLNGLDSTQFLRSDTDDTMDGELTVNGDVTIVDTTSDSSAGPEFSLKRDDAAPADANYLGQLRFDGRNDNGNNRLYAKITGKIGSVVNGSEDGIIEPALVVGGSNRIVTRQTGDALKLINGVGLEVAGDITVDGTVDGRDIAGDGTKLDGIESNATADQTGGEIVSAINTELGNTDWQSGGGGGGGTTITFFQVEDDGTTGQLTTGTATDLAGVWGTPSLTDSDFTWDGTTGILTVNTAGTIEFDIKVCTHQETVNNRHELHVQLYKNGTTILVEDAQYASRNNTLDEGSAYIVGFKDTASVSDTYRIRVFDVGVAATVGAANVAGMTYLSAKLYS